MTWLPAIVARFHTTFGIASVVALTKSFRIHPVVTSFNAVTFPFTFRAFSGYVPTLTAIVTCDAFTFAFTLRILT